VDINMTLIGQSIAMIVFVWFCMKFIWPPILAALEERQKQIEEGLAAARLTRVRNRSSKLALKLTKLSRKPARRRPAFSIRRMRARTRSLPMAKKTV